VVFCLGILWVKLIGSSVVYVNFLIHQVRDMNSRDTLGILSIVRSLREFVWVYGGSTLFCSGLWTTKIFFYVAPCRDFNLSTCSRTSRKVYIGHVRQGRCISLGVSTYAITAHLHVLAPFVLPFFLLIFPVSLCNLAF
jgi:hypothetical protein